MMFWPTVKLVVVLPAVGELLKDQGNSDVALTALLSQCYNVFALLYNPKVFQMGSGPFLSNIFYLQLQKEQVQIC